MIKKAKQNRKSSSDTDYFLLPLESTAADALEHLAVDFSTGLSCAHVLSA